MIWLDLTLECYAPPLVRRAVLLCRRALFAYLRIGLGLAIGMPLLHMAFILARG